MMEKISKYHNREVLRIEAFSDGVFALSATLLVVTLEMPKSFSALLNNINSFFAFALSFAMLIFIWAQHNAFFRRLGMQDGLTILLNSILLFVVLFYVQPLKFITIGLVSTLFGRSNPEFQINTLTELRYMFLIYGIGFVALFLCFVLLYVHALKKAELFKLTDEEKREAKFSLQYHLIFVSVGIISILLTILNIGLQYGIQGWIYSLLGPLIGIHVWRFRRKNLAEGK